MGLQECHQYHNTGVPSKNQRIYRKVLSVVQQPLVGRLQPLEVNNPTPKDRADKDRTVVARLLRPTRRGVDRRSLSLLGPCR